MKHRKRTKKAEDTSHLAPAELAKLNALKRQRRLMARTLLKRRRRKSGQ